MTDVILEAILEVEPIDWGSTTLGTDGEHRQAYIQSLQAADENDYRLLIEFVSGPGVPDGDTSDTDP